MSEMASTSTGRSDAELISAVRSGDNDAYAELYGRHHDAAMRMARQLVPGPDADDLVAEAFLRVMSVVRAGKGPDEFFRAYLLSTIRRLHIDRIRATRRVRSTDDEAELDRVVRFVDPVEMTFEQKAAADAFSSLPERWQLVLWHLDVEGQKPAQIAPLLGLSPNSVSALAYRAREGLRLAYLQGHLAPPLDDTCRWTTSHLGQYVRKALSKRDTARVDQHLDTCSRCAALCLELTEVNSHLPGLLAPVVIGTAAAGYLSSGGATAAAGTLGQVIDWLTKPLRAVGRAGPVAGTAAATVAVAAVSAVAVSQLVSDGEPNAAAPASAPTRSTAAVPSTPVPSPHRPTSKPTPDAVGVDHLAAPVRAAAHGGAHTTPHADARQDPLSVTVDDSPDHTAGPHRDRLRSRGITCPRGGCGAPAWPHDHRAGSGHGSARQSTDTRADILLEGGRPGPARRDRLPRRRRDRRLGVRQPRGRPAAHAADLHSHTDRHDRPAPRSLRAGQLPGGRRRGHGSGQCRSESWE